MIFKQSILILLLCLFFIKVDVSAQTNKQGDVSGTWDIGGSPYILIDDCTVQTGTELTIEPGVEIIIGDSISLNIYGKILANGTSSQHIVFKGVNESLKFNRVYVLNGSQTPPVSEFRYCEFMNAETGLYLHAFGRIANDYTTLETIVSNCIFDISVSTAIHVRAQAKDYSQYMSPRRGHAKVNPIIDGCRFNGNDVGIEMHIQGAGRSWYSNANTEAIIQNNAFFNLPGTAINMLPGTGPSHGGTPSFVNNTIINCHQGIKIQDGDFDAIVINNIFYGTSTAIERTGSYSSTAFYNCFYNNGINFVGYPSTYGNVVMSNRNGYPCDMGFNIFQDPLFENLNHYSLSSGSPCLSAGKDSIENNGKWYYSPSSDIDGNSRSNPIGSHPDIGAYESDKLLKQSIKKNDTKIPSHFSLSGNYPNPFNPSTTISFQLPELSFVNISIYDINGRMLETIINEKVEPGYHTINWNGVHYSSGVYFYKITAAQFSATGKCLLIK